jgi:hypothetical protein
MSYKTPELNYLLSKLEETALSELDNPDFSSSLMHAEYVFGDTVAEFDHTFVDQRDVNTDDRQVRVRTSIDLSHSSQESIAGVTLAEHNGQGIENTATDVFLMNPETGIKLLDDIDPSSHPATCDVSLALSAMNGILITANNHPDQLDQGRKNSTDILRVFSVQPSSEVYTATTTDRETLVSSVKSELAQKGLMLSQKTKHVKLTGGSYVNFSSVTDSSGTIHHRSSPLSIQLFHNDLIYRLAKNDQGGFDQVTTHKSEFYAPQQGENGDSSQTNAEKVDINEIVAREQAERSLGMYDPTSRVLRLVLQSLSHRR